jgi:mono/diheme cytochrome c family protein
VKTGLELVVGGACALSFALVGCAKEKNEAPTVDGAALFSSTCARCHGPDGRGGPSPAPGVPAPRDLRDPALHAERSDEDFASVLRTGKGTAMPAFGSVYDDGQIRALVAHLRSLKGK